MIRLPLRFCEETLASEVRALPRAAWTPHPQRFEGNEYVPLVTPSGLITNDFAGPMGPTAYLQQCPYLMEVMNALDCVWGRSRLMGLGAGADVPEHIDTNYYWRTHVRVHIPIITNPDVAFTCGDETVHMPAGECWVLDTFRKHHVENRGSEQRIHLVLDTVGGERLWDLVTAAEGSETENPPAPAFLEPGTIAKAGLRFEQLNYPAVMSPWEMRQHIEMLLDFAIDEPPLDLVRQRLDRLVTGWRAAWAEFGESSAGLPGYVDLIASAVDDLNRIGGDQIKLGNGLFLYRILHGFVFANAFESERVRDSKAMIAKLADQRLAS